MPLAPCPPLPSSLLPVALLALGLVALGAEAQPSLSMQPGTAKPGDPVLITVRGVEGLPSGTVAGRPLHFFEAAGAWQALTGLPVEQALGKVEVRVVGPRPREGKAVELWGRWTCWSPAIRSGELQVASKYVKPPKSVKAQMAEDSAAFATASPSPSARRCSRATSPGRAATGSPRRSATGARSTASCRASTSARTWTGRRATPSPRPTTATVVMARDCYASGNTVIVHHGGGPLHRVLPHVAAST